ncbi:MAG: hypothetical protein WCK34_00175 [Bacteroidota bacterium]
MKNVHIIKLAGLMALVCFLFFPVIGCGTLTISGFDVIRQDSIGTGVKMFVIIAMLCAIAVIFVPNKVLVFFASAGGIVSLAIAYLIAKGKMSSGDEFGISNAIELKSGSYLSMLGFIFSAVASKAKKELLGGQPEPPAANDDRV